MNVDSVTKGTSQEDTFPLSCRFNHRTLHQGCPCSIRLTPHGTSPCQALDASVHNLVPSMVQSNSSKSGGIGYPSWLRAIAYNKRNWKRCVDTGEILSRDKREWLRFWFDNDKNCCHVNQINKTNRCHHSSACSSCCIPEGMGPFCCTLLPSSEFGTAPQSSASTKKNSSIAPWFSQGTA